MSNFKIDFEEMKILASVTIPPRPIARAMFWQDLTNKYWHQMTEGERAHLFNWLNKNPWYPESLEKEEDTKIFHARFDPDNQYIVKTLHKNEKNRWAKQEHRAFKMGDRYYTGTTTFIAEEYITETTKFTPKKEY